MKKHNYQSALILLYCFLLSTSLFAQLPLNQINITAFTVKNRLPPDVSNWIIIPSSLVLVAQKIPQVQLERVKIVLLIKKNGTKIFGNSEQATAAIDVFTVRNFSATELVGMLAQCPKLLPGSYSLCVQFFNIDNYPISREVCKDFLVEDLVLSYSAPQNMAPANEKFFNYSRIKTPITFRWLPVLPKPKEKVIYRLRIWQLMLGQTAAQAMKLNDIVMDKEVTNVSQTIITNIFTDLCKPTNLCEFVWNVQALDNEGNPFGKNIGMSELSSFTIK